MNQFKDRTLAREFSFKFIYFLNDQTDLEGEINLESLIKSFKDTYSDSDPEHTLTESNPQVDFFSKQILGLHVKSQTDHSGLIESKLSRGKDRQNKIERAILLMSLAESKAFPETPKKVIINEAIELSKRYGTKESSSFINAMLDRLLLGA